jgi:methionyl-tRNA formyltransferase
MRVLTFVNYLTGALVLQDLVDAGEEVVGVVQFPEDPSRALPGPEYSVREVAHRNFLPVYTVRPDQINTDPFVAVVRKLNPDLIVSMHFAKILGRRILKAPPLGAVNMHPSKLPAGRGMTPFVWHMALGEARVHQALHYLDSGIDTGPVIDVASVDVEPEDTGFTVTRKLCFASAAMLRRRLPEIEAGTAPRVPQGEVGASYCVPGYPWNRIVWSRGAVAVERQVRAYTRPMPGAFTSLGGQRMTVWSARLATDEERDQALGASGSPGEVVAVRSDGWLVRTGDGGVVLTDAEVAASGGASGVGVRIQPPAGARVVLG